MGSQLDKRGFVVGWVIVFYDTWKMYFWCCKWGFGNAKDIEICKVQIVFLYWLV